MSVSPYILIYTYISISIFTYIFINFPSCVVFIIHIVDVFFHTPMNILSWFHYRMVERGVSRLKIEIDISTIELPTYNQRIAANQWLEDVCFFLLTFLAWPCFRVPILVSGRMHFLRILPGLFVYKFKDIDIHIPTLSYCWWKKSCTSW